MKFHLLFLFLSLTLFQSVQSQEEFKKMTVISYDFAAKKTKIDSSVYYFSDALPLTRIESWVDLGQTILPIQYSEFIASRRPDSLSVGKFANEIIKKCYNPIKKEWFIYEKRKKISNSKIIYWLTFYHEYHNMYFTTKIKMIFNKNGNLIKAKTYDLYLKRLESKVLYKYE